jgi:hypothetical protein
MNKKGSVLIPVLVYGVALMTIGAYLVTHSARNIFAVKYGYQRALALQAAEAGAEKAIWTLNTGSDLSFLSGKIINDIPAEYEVFIEHSLNRRTIVSTGYSPNKENFKAKRKIKVFLNAGSGNQGLAFNYAVQVGDFGLTMSNNSIINGSVYSNHNIVGNNNSRITGDAYAFSEISSPFPSIGKSKNANTGIKMPLPQVDFETWKYLANLNENPHNGNLIINGTQNIGPRKIVGDLTLGIDSVINLKGPVHVTGNLIFRNNSTLRLDPSFGDDGTVVVVTGKIIMEQNASIIKQGENSFILLASEYAHASDPAITITNNADAGTNTAGGVYYALEGIIRISNNARPAALVGKGLHLNNDAIIYYDSGLASTIFSSGPGGGWRVAGWQLVR